MQKEIEEQTGRKNFSHKIENCIVNDEKLSFKRSENNENDDDDEKNGNAKVSKIRTSLKI